MSSRILRSLSSLASSSSSSTATATAAAGPSTQPQNVLSTLPHKVRQRRLDLPHLSRPSPVNSALPHAPSPSSPGPAQRFPLKLESEFQTLRTKGQFKGDEASARKAFLKGQVAWRSRVRGVSKKKEKSILRGLREEGVVVGESATEEVAGEGEIVGQRIYLPNVQIRLMRNNTPVGEAYDPTIATFRIPPSMTKTDLRSYLSTVYDLPVTFIRTDLYLPPTQRVVGGKVVRQAGSVKNYKRAVVGLTQPFHYPDDVEELRAQGVAAGKGDQWAQQREDWLNDKFQKDRMDENMKRARFKLYKGYRWRSRWHDNEVCPSVIAVWLKTSASSASCQIRRGLTRTGQHDAGYHGKEEGPRIQDSRRGAASASCGRGRRRWCAGRGIGTGSIALADAYYTTTLHPGTVIVIY